MKPYLFLLLLAAMLSWTASAQTATTPIPATGLCNTGLTPASPLPVGCTTSTFVTPVNPQSGGPSVDGNWQLATPYPTEPYGHQAPYPCWVPTFGPAWVDVASSDWFNPNDGMSQWITPLVENPTAGGWYVYRTPLPVPPATPGYTGYELTVSGQIMNDDYPGGIFLGYGRSCTWVSLPTVTLIGNQAPDEAWNKFSFIVSVAPATQPYLYFLVYNIEFAGGNNNGNYQGLRVEFTSAYFTPI